MTPYQISQMSDEEISRELHDRWAMIILLLDALGGEVRIDEERFTLLDFNKAVIESHDDLAAQQRVYRLRSL